MDENNNTSNTIQIIHSSKIMTSDDMTPAERMYKRHLQIVHKYQKNNPDKIKENNKKYNEKLKNENPEKYQELLQKKKEYYKNVRKPKILEQKRMYEKYKDIESNSENNSSN